MSIEDKLHEKLHEDDHDDGPWICPGCYAMGSEPHTAFCPDAAIERELEEDRDRWYDDDWNDEDDDD